MKRAAPAACALLMLIEMAPAARPASAQPFPPPGPGQPAPGFTLLPTATAEPSRSQRPEPPLSPASTQRLRRAVDLRLAGLPERARDSLLVLLREEQGHPRIVTELVRAHMARNDWASAERLARSERLAHHDSLLASRELVLVLERLNRPREAIAVAFESWIAAPEEGQWAAQSVFRHAVQEPRAAKDGFSRAVTATSGRTDFVVGHALLLSRTGQPAEAVKVLSAWDPVTTRVPLRLRFAEDALQSNLAADSVTAREVLRSSAADTRLDSGIRTAAARRLWVVETPGPREGETAAQIAAALADLPGARWGSALLLPVVRSLRESGHAEKARALIASAPEMAARVPELELERAYADLREGPPGRALPGLEALAARWPEARHALAEARFFAGAMDSAAALYRVLAADESHPEVGAAQERLFLIEERPGEPALAGLARIAYERWRGESTRARAIADSLVAATPMSSPYYPAAALELGEMRLAARDARGALVPLLAVADSLPDSRLAPRARQRAGDAYLALGDRAKALAQYEECLVRYPRAWNAAEVRRLVGELRKEPRS